mgnify:CR=1 FL=1
MELKDRLKKARKYAGLTQKEIESKVEGLKQSSYSELERGESKSSTKLVELATLFRVSPVWLATGDGEMLTNPQKELAQILEAGSVSVEGDHDNLVPIPIYDVYFCCGDGNGSCEFENIKGYRNLPPSFFRERNIKPEDFKLICAVNDSNHPYIKDGDEVGIVITDREIKDGEYYAILLDGDRMIKQVFREAGGAYRLSSFNKAYPDKVVTPEHNESLIIAGRQVYRAG